MHILQMNLFGKILDTFATGLLYSASESGWFDGGRSGVGWRECVLFVCMCVYDPVQRLSNVSFHKQCSEQT